MLKKLKHLIPPLLIIIINTTSPTYASQKLQMGNFSISFNGGNFDEGNLKGRLIGVKLYFGQSQIGSAKSVSIDHNFSVEAKKLKNDFHSLANKDGKFTLSFKDLTLKLTDKLFKLNEYTVNVADANFNFSKNRDKIYIHNITLKDAKIEFLDVGFSFLLKKFLVNDMTLSLDAFFDYNQQHTAFMSVDIGKFQINGFRITKGKRHTKNVGVLSIENITVSNCYSYSLLIGVAPDHVCSRNVQNAVVSNAAVKNISPELFQAISENGLKAIKFNSFSKTSYETVRDGYLITSSGTLKIDNFGSTEGKSSMTFNKSLWSDAAALEKKSALNKTKNGNVLEQMMLLLDQTFLHDFRFTIKDDGFLDIVHSYIKNKIPAFRLMSRQQLSLEVNKRIREALKGRPYVADQINPFVNRFINGAGLSQLAMCQFMNELKLFQILMVLFKHSMSL